MSENEEGVIFTPKIEEEGRIDEFPSLDEKSIQIQVSGLTEQSPEYVEFVKNFENKGAVEGVVEGATEGAVEEEKELTEEEKHELFIKTLKESKIRFRNVKHDGNITTVKFGAEYRKKRQHKNRMQKASRKANR